MQGRNDAGVLYSLLKLFENCSFVKTRGLVFASIILFLYPNLLAVSQVIYGNVVVVIICFIDSC